MGSKHYTNQYSPDVVSCPGNTLKAKMDEMGVSIEEFALLSSLDAASILGVLNADIPITTEIASRLEGATQIPSHFWLARQEKYDAFVAASKEPLKRRIHSDWFSRTAML